MPDAFVGAVVPSGSPITVVAFLWSAEGGFVDLNHCIDPSLGWTIQVATDINNDGRIVGSGIFNGQNSVFLLTPVPEPSTLGLLSIGAFILLGCTLRTRKGRVCRFFTRVTPTCAVV